MATMRLFKHHVHSSLYWMAAVDLLGFALALHAGAYLYFMLKPGDFDTYLAQAPLRSLLFASVAVTSLYAMGLYEHRLRERASGILLRTTGGFVATSLVVLPLFYLLPEWAIWREIYLCSLSIAVTVNLTNRLVFTRLLDLNKFKQRVLVLGSGKAASTITRSMRRRADRKGFTIVGFVRMDDEVPQVGNERVINVHSGLSQYARQTEIDQIVVALDERRGNLPLKELMECRVQGIKIFDVVSFFEREAGKILVDYTPPGWMVFSDGFRCDSTSRSSKRLFDIFSSSLLLLVAWPIMLLTCIAIWLEEGLQAPVFFHQQRVGLDGKLFNVLKFRSMRIDAEGDGKARWATKGDDRITRVGHFIRKTRIDELPQILNVLKGDMAFIGPRPERPEFVEQLAEHIPYYNSRHCVKPGITGWAQLCYPYGSCENDAREKLQFDLYYVKNHSLLFDIMIALNTVEVVLFGKGAR